MVGGAASAQDWNLDWGGFMNQHVAFTSVDVGGALTPAIGVAAPDYDGIDVHSNTEIIFSPSVTLDNGMTFGINVQFEGNNNFSVDESYMTISSDTMGRVEIGSENSAGYKMMVGAPGVVSMAINSPSISSYIPFSAAGIGNSFRQGGLSTYTEVAGNNDVRRISYYTPSFNGLTVGVSYARDGVTNAGNSFAFDSKRARLSDVFDIGVGYSQSFGSVDVDLAARWGTGSYASWVGAAPVINGPSDPETWGIGAQFGFGAFTVGGSYAVNDNGALFGAGDQEGWDFGVTYDAAGPWAFELSTFQGEFDNGLGVTKDEYQAYRLGASRDLGPGVDWDIYAVMVEADAGNAIGAFGPGVGTEIEGTTIGTAINLSF